VLDVGCGAGRFALALAERGVPVTALDTSPGALAVCRERGVSELVCGTVSDLPAGRAYDTFLLMGENLGVLENARRAAGFLGELAAIARPGARIIAHGADPYPVLASDPELAAYLRRSREPGALPGELTIRLRHRDLATSWFGYLLCSPDELASLAAPTQWELTRADYADKANYLAVLSLRRLAAPARRRARPPAPAPAPAPAHPHPHPHPKYDISGYAHPVPPDDPLALKIGPPVAGLIFSSNGS
jgi:SAM-dependent methyltransferase